MEADECVGDAVSIRGYGITVLSRHEILQFLDFEDGDCPPYWIFKIAFFSKMAVRWRHCGL